MNESLTTVPTFLKHMARFESDLVAVLRARVVVSVTISAKRRVTSPTGAVVVRAG